MRASDVDVAGTIPTVIVGPSHDAIEHPTVHHANSTDDYRGFGSLRTADLRVISPGVNLRHFDPELFRGDRVTTILQYHSQSVLDSSLNPLSEVKPYFVIAFVGRLSVEKNVGLFLMAAELILERCAHCRFTVVGDGALRENLELLCDQLGISWAVHFAGIDVP